MRYKEIKNRIQSHYEKLPKNQKVIADYFIDNFDKIPFLSVHDISGATLISVASIVRFAQRVGFSGYQEMRDEIGKTLQNDIQNKEIFSLIDNNNIKDDTLTSVANQDISNINETLLLIDRKNFDCAVSLILKSKRIYTGGLGISFLLAQILSYQLNQVGIDAANFNHNYSSFMEQILFLKKSDVIIFFSFPPYSKETIDAAKFAAERGIKIIAITNKNASPITRYSEYHLAVKSENMLFTNSFSAISVLINAIATQCALKARKKAEKMIDDFNQITMKQDIVINEK